MTRKSQRLSSSSQAPIVSHKRAVSGSTITGRAMPKRPKQDDISATTSKYFPRGSDGPKDISASDNEAEASSDQEDEASEFGGESEDSPPSEPDDHDEYDSDDDRPKASKKNSNKSVAQSAKGKELWRPGVKTGLGPGTQVVIKKPKARAAGKTPYEDETIHPNTMLFLADLKANNDRQWLKSMYRPLSSVPSPSSNVDNISQWKSCSPQGLSPHAAGLRMVVAQGSCYSFLS